MEKEKQKGKAPEPRVIKPKAMSLISTSWCSWESKSYLAPEHLPDLPCLSCSSHRRSPWPHEFRCQI